ncbi:MAG: hypothetical protein WC963_05400 [Bacilli bacterium]
MLIHETVKFKEGSVLTKDMLESTYNYPHNFCDLYYSELSDGIIVGLTFFYDEENTLYLKKGIYKYNSKLYFLTYDYNLDKELDNIDYQEGEEYLIVLEHKQCDNCANIFTDKLLPKIIKNTNEAYIVIGRFIYRKGIKPKLNYSCYNDFDDNNFIKIIENSYANYNKPSLAKDIFYFFAIEMKNYSCNSILSAFLVKALNYDFLSNDLLKNIFPEINLSSNIDTYNSLKNILKKYKNNKKSMPDELQKDEKPPSKPTDGPEWSIRSIT